jgi:hypothetical protein
MPSPAPPAVVQATDGRERASAHKQLEARYYPGTRSPAWLKLKTKLSLEVTVTGSDADRLGRLGNRGQP